MTSSAEPTDWLERDQKVVAQSPYAPPLVLEKGRRCEVWDVHGRRFLDFESGQFCMSTGHSHPRIAQVAGEQAAILMQIGNRFTNPARILLAERLADLAPDPLAMSFFCSTGSEANETALRIAKLVTGRFEVLAQARGYHGRTASAYGASSSARRMRRGAGPQPPGIGFISPPYTYRCPFTCGTCDLSCWKHSIEMVDRATSGEPAAVIVEFVLGAGGVIPVPPDWAKAVRQFCDERDALLIADEALTGLGRTGRWFAFEHAGIVPDIVVISKALGGGVPTAAIITTGAVAEAALQRGFIQAASHQGDPFQCAVALANLDVIQEEDLVRNAERMGQRLADGLQRLATRHQIVGEARGLGLIAGLEIIDGVEEAPELAAVVSLACLERGLIVGGLRPGIREGNTLRFAPPLTVTAAEIDEALTITEAALVAVDAGQSGRTAVGATAGIRS
ncbi:aspartate aminotransferase family protein [Nonomuraea sp. M3C6]|uniref:Aspartate aminotransferase family protein n=1 Tax=Nonomuraea marmarensis TaxID=3351344 RepID=A0ABW7AU28_9ACTN